LHLLYSAYESIRDSGCQCVLTLDYMIRVGTMNLQLSWLFIGIRVVAER
jgi:hypothetical protein